MRWPFVSRFAFELLHDEHLQLRARYDALLVATLGMRRDGFAPQTKAIIRDGSPDPDTVGLERAETQRVTQLRAAADREFITRAASDIVRRTGVTRSDAEREARRLLEEARAEHPSGG